MITILDYGIGNINSISNMIKKVNGKSLISSELKEISAAKKMIICGVGAFDNGMRNIEKYREILDYKVLEEKIPILGICLGMQLFTKSSDEGELPGLGWIDAETVRFNFSDIETKEKLRTPHMGWNQVNTQKDSLLFEDMYESPRFYHVHSYYVVPKHKRDILCTTQYGYQFASGVEHENILAVQFHPEKSHKYGIKLFENFVKNY